MSHRYGLHVLKEGENGPEIDERYAKQAEIVKSASKLLAGADRSQRNGARMVRASRMTAGALSRSTKCLID